MIHSTTADDYGPLQRFLSLPSPGHATNLLAPSAKARCHGPLQIDGGELVGKSLRDLWPPQPRGHGKAVGGTSLVPVEVKLWVCLGSLMTAHAP